MKSLLYIVIIFICFVQCKPDAGFGGNKAIRGYVYIKDTLSDPDVPAAGATIYICFNHKNESAYNYSIKTDESGSYSFEFLQKLEKGNFYYLFCRDTISINNNSIAYFDSVTVEDFRNKDEVAKNLYLEKVNQYGEYSLSGKIFISDVLLNSISAKTSVEVIVTSSARPATFNEVKATSDKNGYYHFHNIPEGNYTIIFNYTDSSGNQYQASNTITFKKEDNTLKDLRLDDTLQLVSDHDLLLILQDSTSDAPMTNLSFCLFSSYTAFAGNDDCGGSMLSGRTNSMGRAIIKEVSPNAKYYVHISDSLGKVKVFARDTIAMGVESLATKVVKVK